MDDEFWRGANRVLKITKHIYAMIRFCDSDKAVIGEVYEQMDSMLGLIRDSCIGELDTVYDQIHNPVVERWNMNIPLAHCDKEIQKGNLGAVDKMILDYEEAALVRQQISDFVSSKGVFAQPQAVSDRATMNSLQWWHLYGGAAPEFYSLTLKVLSQSVNNSFAERCWSTFSYIHSCKRNRLNVQRDEKLVFVHYNRRLLTRCRDDYETTNKNWGR